MTHESTPTHIKLQYLPDPKAIVWRNSSLTMWAAGRANMERTAANLQKQNNWYAWRIVPHTPA